MKKFVYTFIIILLLMMIYPSFVNAFEVSATPSEVMSGETFYFSISFDENIYLTNGHIKYDSDLFEFISCDTENVEIEKIADGEIAWFYTELQDSPSGIQNLDFKFRSSIVAHDTATSMVIEDGIYIGLDENVYEEDKIANILIYAKEMSILPATGGIGTFIFFIVGIGLIGLSAVILLKRDKKEE